MMRIMKIFLVAISLVTVAHGLAPITSLWNKAMGKVTGSDIGKKIMPTVNTAFMNCDIHALWVTKPIEAEMLKRVVEENFGDEADNVDTSQEAHLKLELYEFTNCKGAVALPMGGFHEHVLQISFASHKNVMGCKKPGQCSAQFIAYTGNTLGEIAMMQLGTRFETVPMKWTYNGNNGFTQSGDGDVNDLAIMAHWQGVGEFDANFKLEGPEADQTKQVLVCKPDGHTFKGKDMVCACEKPVFSQDFTARKAIGNIALLPRVLGDVEGIVSEGIYQFDLSDPGVLAYEVKSKCHTRACTD